MKKALQALLDTFVVAAGAIQVGDTSYPGANAPRERLPEPTAFAAESDVPAESTRRQAPKSSRRTGRLKKQPSL